LLFLPLDRGLSNIPCPYLLVEITLLFSSPSPSRLDWRGRLSRTTICPFFVIVFTSTVTPELLPWKKRISPVFRALPFPKLSCSRLFFFFFSPNPSTPNRKPCFPQHMLPSPVELFFAAPIPRSLRIKYVFWSSPLFPVPCPLPPPVLFDPALDPITLISCPFSIGRTLPCCHSNSCPASEAQHR